MKTINKYFLSFFIMAFLLGACTDDFEEINTDPNNPVLVPAENLLTEAQFRLAERIWGRPLNFGMAMLMVQHFSLNEYAENSRFNLSNSLYNASWSSFYAGILTDLNEAVRLTEADETITEAVKNNRMAALTVLRVYTYQTITDTWGRVPYSQAHQPDEFPNPEYDTQEAIYDGLLNEINTAISQISLAEAGFSSGDVIFQGDMAMWGKFANSLKVRLGMRLTEVAPAKAQTIVSEAFNNPLGVFSAPGEGADFVFGASQEIANPFFVDAVTRDDFAISEILVTRLQERNDPRLAAYALPNTSGNFVGIPYGLTDPETFLFKPQSSRPNSSIRQASAPAKLLSYSEIEFFRAEAIERGFITGDAGVAFNNAVTASMLEWGLTAADAEAYLEANPYNSANWRQIIGYEKWVALYTHGLEAWAERRRLDAPDLPVPAAAVIDQIPVRFFYPAIEAEANEANLTAVGENNLTSNVWWDVN